jgi:hypothetical protein
MANINPKQEEVASRIPEFREKFKKKYEKELSSGVYDDRDVQRFSTDDIYAGCFLRTIYAKGDPDKALDNVHECLKFRKDIALNDLTDESFPLEGLQKNANYYKGTDKDGHPIMYINVKENTAKADQQQLLKNYIAYKFEEHHKVNPGQMVVVMMDMSGASTSNVSIDISKYIIACFTNYFPTFLAYMINYEMPTLLSGIWSVISAFLKGDQKKKLLVLRKKDIKNYIPEEHLWPHMK